MLRGARFWFSRLTLVHALCLWSLPDDARRPAPTRRRVVDLEALVEHWLAASGRPAGASRSSLEARKLAVWALDTGQPERFIWIDESGVLARVGSRPASRESGASTTSGSRRRRDGPPSTRAPSSWSPTCSCC